MTTRLMILILGMHFPAIVFAWDGYDYDAGAYVEIDSGNTVRSGNDIEYYDHGTGEYKSGEVQSIESYGSSTEVEVYDYDSGEYRTFSMDE